MRRLISIVAFTGFAVSFVIHAATFWGVDLISGHLWVWALHIGIFPLGGLLFFSLRDLFPMWEGGQVWKKVYASMPTWLRYAAYAFFAYALINFLLFFLLSEGGSPDFRDGKFVLHDHGKIIRELTEEEYRLQMAYVLRFFSGHWMFFYLTFGAHFWFPKPKVDSLPPPDSKLG